MFMISQNQKHNGTEVDFIVNIILGQNYNIRERVGSFLAVTRFFMFITVKFMDLNGHSK